jgi:hypothetical protein
MGTGYLYWILTDPSFAVKRKVFDIPSLGQCVPWMMGPKDIASLGHAVPDQCVLTLDCIEVLVKISYFGLYDASIS